MTVRTLHLLGSPVLRQKAARVGVVDDEVRQLVDDLFETMRAAKGVGLAANQIGVARRVAVVDIGEEDPPPLVLINPKSGDKEKSADERLSQINAALRSHEIEARVIVPESERSTRKIAREVARAGRPLRLNGGVLLRGKPSVVSHMAANVGAGFGDVGVARRSTVFRTSSIS